MEIKERAMADLKRIEATIVRLEDQLQRARDDRVKLQHFLEVTEKYARDGGEEEAEKAAAGTRRASKAARIRDLAYAFVCQRREPVQSGDIAQFVIDRGEDIPSPDKGSYVSSVLNRDDRFHNIRNVGWVLAGTTRAGEAESGAAQGGSGRQPEPTPEREPEPEAEWNEDDIDLGGSPRSPYVRAEPEPPPPPRPQPRYAGGPVPQMRVVNQAARAPQRSVADELDDDIPF